MHGFFELGLGVQIALGFGYLGYLIGYAGLRRHHVGTDRVFISIAFGVVGLLAFTLSKDLGLTIAVALSAIAVMLAGVIWRGILRHWFLKILNRMQVHQDDGLHFGWDQFIQNIGNVLQASVRLTDGRVLYLNDRRKYKDAPHEGLYLGGDGSVIMIVEEEEFPDGKTEARDGITSDWGTRLTYIAADRVVQVNLRTD